MSNAQAEDDDHLPNGYAPKEPTGREKVMIMMSELSEQDYEKLWPVLRAWYVQNHPL